MTRVNGFSGVSEASVGSGELLESFVRVHALIDRVEHGSELDELVADDFVLHRPVRFR